MPATLGYWKIRGLAAPIRLILEYCGVDYKEDVYVVGPPPEYSREDWYKVKFNLGLGPFANLPYYKDGDTAIVESLAIINHLSRKYNLDGNSEDERIRCDIMLFKLKDITMRFTAMAYGSFGTNFEEQKEVYLKELPDKLQSFVEYLGDNQFFAGNSISKVDFLVYEFLSQMSIFEPPCLEKFPTLKKFMERIEDIPAIAEYLKSDRYYARPVNNPTALWK